MQISYDLLAEERTDVLLDVAMEIHQECAPQMDDFVTEIMTDREKCSKVIRIYDTLIGRFCRAKARARANPEVISVRPPAVNIPVPYSPLSKLERYRINQGLNLLAYYEGKPAEAHIWTFDIEDVQMSKAQHGLVVQNKDGAKYILYDHKPTDHGPGSRMTAGWKLKNYNNGKFLRPEALQFTYRNVRSILEWLYAYDYQLLDEVLEYVTFEGSARKAQILAFKEAAGDLPDQETLDAYAKKDKPVKEGATYFSPRDGETEATHLVIKLQPKASDSPGWAAYDKYTGELVYHSRKMHPFEMHAWLKSDESLSLSRVK